MVNQELATIKEYDIPVVVAILNNRKLGMVYQWQHLMYNQRYAETDMGNSPDFVKLAESYGINAERVTDVGETQKVLSKALNDNEALVVDIEIEKNEFIPMFPAGEPVDFVLGEYKYESDAKASKWAKKYILTLSAFWLKTSQVLFKESLVCSPDVDSISTALLWGHPRLKALQEWFLL